MTASPFLYSPNVRVIILFSIVVTQKSGRLLTLTPLCVCVCERERQTEREREREREKGGGGGSWPQDSRS